MLRRMKVTMVLADADSVADGILDLLGGGWNITDPRAWHGQTCAVLEACLAPLPVPWEASQQSVGEAADGNHGPHDHGNVAGRVRDRRRAG
jgi:hypothetical protein